MFDLWYTISNKSFEKLLFCGDYMQETRKLKLNYKNTLIIGMAFFGILMLWQVYNTYCPIILEAMLRELLHAENTNYIVGIIMALDNVVAIIIMPLFGKVSDKTNSRWGKRMPYVFIGMLLTCIVFPFIALMCMWNMFAGVIVFMMLFLVIMQAYRSPAVALMPDVTPKPLRSSANGLINLIGYLGGVFATILGMFGIFKLNSESTLLEIQNKVIWPFVVCTAVLVAVLIFLLIKLKEPKMLAETKDDVEYGENLADTLDEINDDNSLSKSDKKNLIILLVAIFLWFMAFNSFETFGSLYFKNIVGDSTMYSLMATVLSVVSIVTFIFLSSISNKIGRKATVAAGIILIAIALISIAVISLLPNINFLNAQGNVSIGWKIFYIGMSVLIGIGWALININSFPMVVEYSNTKNLGKFTSYYYMASMLAQSITPIAVGLIMDFNSLGQKLLFVYASSMMILAFIVFLFIKEKIKLKDRIEKNKKNKKQSTLEKLGSMDD